MTYNSVIILKGIRTPIIVSFKEAVAVKEVYDDKEVAASHVFNLKNKSFSKGEIKYVEVVKDGSVSDTWNSVVHEDNVKGWEERKLFLRMKPEQRAKRLHMFFYMFKISTGREPTLEELERAEMIQLDFFKGNQSRTLCDFNLLMPIIPINERRKMVSHFDLAYFRFLENAGIADYKDSKKAYN